jgi:hypothetical protein
MVDLDDASGFGEAVVGHPFPVAGVEDDG